MFGLHVDYGPALCRVSLISLAYFLCEKNGVEEIVRPRPPRDDQKILKTRSGTGSKELGILGAQSVTKERSNSKRPCW